MGQLHGGESLVWELRSALKKAVRAFFELRGYLEVDTPVVVVCPGVEVHLGYFPTTWVDGAGAAHSRFLRSSPELHMKQALARGPRRIFQIAACFRNCGELSPWHHPEFTLLEWYEAGAGFADFMAQTEELLRFTREEVGARHPGRVTLELPPRFERVSVADAFREFAGIDLVDLDPDLARKAAGRGVPSVGEGDDFEAAYFKVLIEKVEPALERLGGAVLFDYPPSQAVLAKVEGGWAKRFEFYLNGVELCNAFLELTDPIENRRRVRDAFERRRETLTPSPCPQPSPDEEFFKSLEAGIPPCAGNAFGFDRWLALLVGERGIAGVVPFRSGGIFPQGEGE